MTALESLITGRITSVTVARFTTRFIASLMPTAPFAIFHTRHAWLTTAFSAFAMPAFVATRLSTRRALTRAADSAGMPANQGAPAFLATGFVEATLETGTTSAWARMFAIEKSFAFLWACIFDWVLEAFHADCMSAWQRLLHINAACFLADMVGFAAVIPACMTAVHWLTT